MSSKYLTAQWYDQECTEVPDVMYIWTMSNPKISKQPTTEVWPIGYTNQASRLPFDMRCYANLKVPLSKECCSVVLYKTKSLGYTSSTTIQIPIGSNPLDKAPASSNGHDYCLLTSTPSISGSLWGYEQVYYATNERCIAPDNIKCNKNNTISIYPSVGCTGTPVNYNLTPDSASITTSTTQTVGATLVKIQTAQSVFSWFMSVDMNTYYPNGTRMLDYVFFGVFAIAYIMIIWSFSIKLVQYYKKRTAYNLGLVFCQLFWMAHIILKSIGNVIGYTAIVDGLVWLFQNLASIFTIFLSTWFMGQMFFITKQKMLILYTCWILLFLGCTWNHFLRFNRSIILPTAVRNVTKVLNAVWIYILFIFGVIPPTTIILRIIKMDEKNTSPLKVIWKADKIFCGLYLVQLFALSIFVCQDQLRNNSELLGDDRNWYCMMAFETLSIGLQGCITIVMISRMLRIIRNGGLNTATKLESRVAKPKDTRVTT
ncbi:hypothetical protein BC833DRAFT_569593 [Globomyces pollinis-pini]|nr:hypothetical protein BC833DRAFT_569593 [Globomyces pollinis-pini]